jgi:ethanolamine utilization protein EutP (predicted NTPase)
VNFAGCLEGLDEAIAAAASLGLDTTAAAGVRDTARERARFPSDTYVLALVGGTGVGKSTLLNALAGEEVSAASARRPTTAEPVAWIPSGKTRELADLVAWLGVTRVREHAGDGLADLAVLDLPDIDSVAAEHRARVDAVLPRVDAVAWVVDPQKYGDDVAHTPYLRTWGPRIARQIVVLNRADLLSPQDATRVRDDLRARLRDDGLDDADVAVTSARDGARGVAALREWLESGVAAKRVVAMRSGSAARDAAHELARAAGVDQGVRPLVDPARRKRAMDDVTRGALAVIDIRGLERQAVAATRLAARPRGAGPFGHVTSLIYRMTGRARASADPAGFLRRWRTRGSLAPALEPLRDLVAAAVPSVPPALRRRVADLSEPAAIEPRLAEAIDRTLAAEASRFTVPTSALWSLIGFGQYLVTALLLFTALWFGALFVVHDTPTGSVVLPILGPVPTPVIVLAAALLAGYVLANALRLHAGWLGRRWARHIGTLITREALARVRESVLLPLDAMDAAREQLARAVRTLDDACA